MFIDRDSQQITQRQHQDTYLSELLEQLWPESEYVRGCGKIPCVCKSGEVRILKAISITG